MTPGVPLARGGSGEVFWEVFRTRNPAEWDNQYILQTHLVMPIPLPRERWCRWSYWINRSSSLSVKIWPEKFSISQQNRSLLMPVYSTSRSRRAAHSL